jgi:multiple sugar transport system substrate-binding protein
MMRRQVPRLAALAGILALGAGAHAQDQSAAEIAVEAAKQYAGTTLNITWEAGLQALDPLNFSGPKWEELTGIKINVVEVPINELFTKTLAEHRAGTGAYDMLNVVPAWIPDLAEAGVLEPLDGYVD